MPETPLFKKLNFKQQAEILVIHAPAALAEELKAMKDFTLIREDIGSVQAITFVLAFIKTQAEIDSLTPLINEKLQGDGIVWFAYPKGASKKYTSEINRDKGWQMLGQCGFEAVRQVAIDDDWSALRFRKVAFIKTMRRNADLAMTQEGQARTKTSGHKHI